jgi:isoquinoline 1-oxidoreductase alpha subunit
MPQLTINGELRSLDLESEMPLLWVLRDELGLTGTKFGCGIASCGACTVEVDGVATRSCVLPLSAVEGKSVRTIEAAPDKVVQALQQAWLKLQVPQCGYCQSGMILAAATLLRQNPEPSDADIDAAITNICRCGTYQRIRAAIHAAALSLKGSAA